ncbi:SDR family NAD(P)-dependent oxidoreductase [Paraglaciecola arctica]|uniref:3-hydroxybutyrate dehydrogenase type 2 n=1 Tax=Paraglaciecola arctica BSs20135 TaxID=493475 RepID=K6Y3S3_9ALTE|nr:glucose 1-dehydrogenase [Paraglaciecola arctica]GAC18621.1 3-hydroxybutyrate dehydrogenase type 2 [Paraglaciecola arctica BSs20135]
MNQNLTDKTALVTGGGSGIGKSVCLRLAAAGAHVLVLDLDEQAATETVVQIQSENGSASAHPCNIADHDNVQQVINNILHDRLIDILINNAGIAHVGNLENTSEADLDRLYQVNVKGVYNAMAATIPAMKARKSGVIINMASVASSVGIADRFAYSMTKGAVLTMTYSVAKDYINDGIRCNCIAPGRVHTPFVDNFLDKNYPDNRDEMFDKLSKSQPIGRMGQADEIAGLVAYLCSDEASFITGSNFPIDGGFVTLNN